MGETVSKNIILLRNQQLVFLGKEDFLKLPNPEVWIKRISTLEQAQQIARLYEQCENWGRESFKKASQVFKIDDDDDDDRTNSNPGPRIIEAVRDKVEVVLRTIDPKIFTTEGSTGSGDRENYILGAIQTNGVEAFKNLPPIVLRKLGNQKLTDYLKNERMGKLSIVDGYTRISVAKKLGIKLPAYIIYG